MEHPEKLLSQLLLMLVPFFHANLLWRVRTLVLVSRHHAIVTQICTYRLVPRATV